MYAVTLVKKPPLEAVSLRLSMAVAGTAHDPGRENDVLLLLGILRESGMSPCDAHTVFEKHRKTPEILRTAGMTRLADWAEEVIVDIESRQYGLAKAA